MCRFVAAGTIGTSIVDRNGRNIRPLGLARTAQRLSDCRLADGDRENAGNFQDLHSSNLEVLVPDPPRNSKPSKVSSVVEGEACAEADKERYAYREPA